jgi:hypothetical protein
LSTAAKPDIHIRPAPESRTVTCADDTAFYSYLKEELVGTGFYNGTVMYNGLITEYSQAFQNSGPLTINGLAFIGGVQDAVNPAQTINATLVLYNVDGAYMPTTQIASANVTLTTIPTSYVATLSSPVTVTGNYAVAIKNTSLTDTVLVFMNNANDTTYGEGLGYLNAGGWLPPSVFGATKAFEALTAPVISTTINTDFLVSPSSPICVGTTLVLSNITTPMSTLMNRMYNYGAFNAFWNAVPDSIFAWDMDDGSPLIWTSSTSHTFGTAGVDTITLYTLGGLLTSCIDSKELYMTVEPNPVAGFTSDGSLSPMFSFINTSTDATSYTWDFGDGSPTDNSTNPTHVYGPGTYTVTLDATNSCGTVTTTDVIVVLPTGIKELNENQLSIYPNPSTGTISIALENAALSLIEVYNVLGEKVYSESFAALRKELDLSSLDAGMYSIRIRNPELSVSRQLILTK